MTTAFYELKVKLPRECRVCHLDVLDARCECSVLASLFRELMKMAKPSAPVSVAEDLTLDVGVA